MVLSVRFSVRWFTRLDRRARRLRLIARCLDRVVGDAAGNLVDREPAGRVAFVAVKTVSTVTSAPRIGRVRGGIDEVVPDRYLAKPAAGGNSSVLHPGVPK